MKESKTKSRNIVFSRWKILSRIGMIFGLFFGTVYAGHYLNLSDTIFPVHSNTIQLDSDNLGGSTSISFGPLTPAQFEWDGTRFDLNSHLLVENGFRVGESNLVVEDGLTGKVGIKTLTPGSELDVKGTLRLSGSTSGYVGFSPAPAAGSTTYTLPSSDGTSGQVLQTNGSGTLSWATVSGGGGSGITSLNGLIATTQTLAIGTSGTAPAWSSITSTHTLNIPMASIASVTAGLISKTDYDAFNNKANSGANSNITSLTGLTTPLSVAQGGTGQSTYTNGQLLIGNTTGGTLTKSTLTAGTGINVTNGTGTITLSAVPPLSSITAATASNTISNGNNPQTWNWQLATTNTGLTLGESAASTGTPTIFKISTLTGSTALPFQITHNSVSKLYVSTEGNDLYLNANGSISDIAQIVFAGTAGTGDFRIGSDGGDIFWQGGGSRLLQMGAYWPILLTGDAHATTFPSFINGGGLYSGASTIIMPASGRTADVGLVVRGIASQTGNLTQWQNSTGTILSSVNSDGAITVGQNGTSITRHLSATTSLNLPRIDGACTSQTVTVTGAAIGDTVIASPTFITGGIQTVTDSVWSAYVSASDTITLRVCDIFTAGSGIDAADQTWRVDVWQH